jgi:hypothetical protein
MNGRVLALGVPVLVSFHSSPPIYRPTVYTSIKIYLSERLAAIVEATNFVHPATHTTLSIVIIIVSLFPSTGLGARARGRVHSPLSNLAVT